jgi:hypothetical protein
MTKLAEFRRQYPQYGDMNDNDLADRLYQRHYSDMSRTEFDRSLGLQPNRYQQLVDERPGWIPEWYAKLVGGIESSGAGLRDSVTLGYGDEMVAALPTLQQGDSYESRVADERGALSDAYEYNPAATIAGQFGGGVALPMKSGGLWSSVGQGAAYGGVYGHGSGEGNAVDRLGGAAVGTVLGGGAGGGGHSLGKLIGAIATGIKGAVGPARERALDMVQRRLAASNMDPADIQTVLNELRAAGGEVQEGLMDVGGQNVLGLARATANVQGPGKEIIRSRLVGRAVGPNPEKVTDEVLEGAGRRIAERGLRGQGLGKKETRQALEGGARGYQAGTREINRRASGVARPFYERAKEAPFPPAAFEEAFVPLFKDPDLGWQGTAKRALLMVRGQAGTNEQRALGALSRGEMPDPADLTIGVMHRLRRALNSEIGVATRTGDDPLAADLIDARKNFFDPWMRAEGPRRSIGSFTPEEQAYLRSWGIVGPDDTVSIYDVGRKTVASAHDLTEARIAGQSVFDTPEAEFYAWVDDLSEPERAAAALGALRAVIERAGRNPNSRQAIQLILNGNMRERMRLLWPKDARGGMRPINDFFRRLGRERTMQETMNYIIGGSRTAPMMEEIMDATMRETPMNQVLEEIESLIRGKGVQQIGRNAAAALFNRSRQPGIYNPKINKEVAELLSQPLDDQLIADLTAAQARAAARRAARTGAGNVGARVATAAGRTGAGPRGERR